MKCKKVKKNKKIIKIIKSSNIKAFPGQLVTYKLCLKSEIIK